MTEKRKKTNERDATNIQIVYRDFYFIDVRGMAYKHIEYYEYYPQSIALDALDDSKRRKEWSVLLNQKKER